MYALLRDYDAGVQKPVSTTLATPTEPLTSDEKHAAEFIALAVGLRAAVCEYRPLLCSSGFLAAQLGWRHKMRAYRALKGLCDKGVIESAGAMPGSRTRLYELAAEEVVAAAPPVADGIEADDAWSVDQREEPGEDAAVRRAVPGDRGEVREGDDWLVAPRDLTGDVGFVHGDEYNGPTGRNK